MKQYKIIITINEEEIKNKCLENYTEEELIKLLPDISSYIIHIVYDYLHRSKSETAFAFARRFNISEPLVYKYLKQVKQAFKNSNK